MGKTGKASLSIFCIFFTAMFLALAVMGVFWLFHSTHPFSVMNAVMILIISGLGVKDGILMGKKLFYFINQDKRV